MKGGQLFRRTSGPCGQKTRATRHCTKLSNTKRAVKSALAQVSGGLYVTEALESLGWPPVTAP